jgi:molybdate transport system substrate-binding protein
MPLSRRTLLCAATLVPFAQALPAQAAIAHYPLHCDPELAPALNAAALAFLARTDIRVHILPTSSGLLVPQIAHVVQSDIVMTRADTVAVLEAIGHKVEGAPHPRFAGRLVLAALAGTPDDLARGGPIAAPDPLPSSTFDSAAVLARLDLSRVRIFGTVDTEDAAYLVTSGAARAGLLYLSDARADPRLRLVAEVPQDAYPPIIYIAATTQTPRRPQPEAFVAFLASPAGAAILASFGLEQIT